LGVKGSEEFCWYILKNASVFVAPGIDYGDDERVFMGYSLPIWNMKLGIERIQNVT